MRLWSACVGLSAIATVYCTTFAEAAQQDSVVNSAAGATQKQGSKDIEKDCEDEWKANRDIMMKGDMTEESYVRQCIVRDDVPGIPEPKTNTVPSSAPK